MKQKKVEVIFGGDDLGNRNVSLSEHTSLHQKPTWSVLLTETEFCEITEFLYAEYCRLRRRTGRPVAGKIGSKNGYFINVSTYVELAKNLDGRLDIAEALRRLVTSRGSKHDLILAKKWALQCNEHGFVAFSNIILEENDESH